MVCSFLAYHLVHCLACQKISVASFISPQRYNEPKPLQTLRFQMPRHTQEHKQYYKSQIRRLIVIDHGISNG
jgi:hypothetical protein